MDNLKTCLPIQPVFLFLHLFLFTSVYYLSECSVTLSIVQTPGEVLGAFL